MGLPAIILIVEDNVIASRMAGNLIKRTVGEGYEIHRASNAQDAMTFLTKNEHFSRTELILLDQEMPGGNGEELLESLSGYHANDLPKFIFCSSNESGNEILMNAANKIGLQGYDNVQSH